MGQIKGDTDKWMGVAWGPPLDRKGRRTERELPSVRVTLESLHETTCRDKAADKPMAVCPWFHPL